MNRAMKATTKTLSICPCGYLVLRDNLGLGTEFEIHPEETAVGLMICGGCSKFIQVRGVFCEARGDSAAGYLPMAIFEEPKEIAISE